MSWMHHNYDPRKHRKFVPKNKKKYTGKNYPVTRSEWEWAFCNGCDSDPRVVEWSSESVVIPYIFQGKKRRYYPDFFIKVLNRQGNVDKYLIEIKPAKEGAPPRKKANSKKSRTTQLREQTVGQKNKAKGEAAKRVCRKMGWNGKVMTEKELFGGK